MLALLAAQPPAERRRGPREGVQGGPSLTIEEYEPKSTLVVPQHPVTRASYPFIDVHNHQYGAHAGRKVDKLVADMDGINLRIMVNLSGGYGDKLKQPSRIMKGRYKDRFVVFANIDFSNIDDPDYSQRAAAQFEKDVKSGAQGLKIFKNFGMDLKDSKGQRIHVDDPRFDQIFEARRPAESAGADSHRRALVVLPAAGQEQRALARAEAVPASAPGRPRSIRAGRPSWTSSTTCSRNIRRPSSSTRTWAGWAANLAELGRLMEKMPNMYTEIGAVLAELGRQPQFARQWFIDHQDRVLFGKDIWEPTEYYCYFRVLETADEYFDYYRKRHAFWKMYGWICRMKC